jgi:hypothetical protein
MDDSVTVLFNAGDGTFDNSARWGYYATGNGTSDVCAGDLDGDGDIDLAAGNAYTNSVAVLLNTGTGVFGTHTDWNCYDHPFALCLGDIEGDGDLDLITGSEDGEYMGFSSVVPNNGDATFEWFYSKYLGGGGALGVTAADLTGDGFLDIAATGWQKYVSVLINNGDGSLANYVGYSVERNPHAIVSADFDSDGDMDLATINRDSASVSVLYNGNPPSCCEGITGNIDCDPDGLIDIGDLTCLINYLYLEGESECFCCLEEGNVDGDLGVVIDIGDLTSIIAYLFIPPNPIPAECP